MLVADERRFRPYPGADRGLEVSRASPASAAAISDYTWLAVHGAESRPGQDVRLRVLRRLRGSRRDFSSSIWRIRSLRTSASA